MRTAAIVCNVVVFVAIGLIVLTEGVPRDAWYLVFTFLVLLVPLLSGARVGMWAATRTMNGRRPSFRWWVGRSS